MTNFERMENELREAGRIQEASRINSRSLTADERTKIFEARNLALEFALSESYITAYLEEGAEQIRTVLR